MRQGKVPEAVRDIPGPSGPLEVLVEPPVSRLRAAVVFAHPLPTHGGTMHTKVVFQGAKALVRIGCAVLRFNFRGVGRSAGVWDAANATTSEPPSISWPPSTLGWSCGRSGSPSAPTLRSPPGRRTIVFVR